MPVGGSKTRHLVLLISATALAKVAAIVDQSFWSLSEDVLPRECQWSVMTAANSSGVTRRDTSVVPNERVPFRC